MKNNQIVIIKRWKPILEEYEKIQNKVSPRSFKLVKDLCQAHHISNKELRRYYRKWLEGSRQDESLLPRPAGARPGSRRTPKDIRTVFKMKNLYVAACLDDCTRLTYAEILKDKKSSTLTYFMTRGLSWFTQIYSFQFEEVRTSPALLDTRIRAIIEAIGGY